MMLTLAFCVFSPVLLQIASSQRIRFPEGQRWGGRPSFSSQSSSPRNVCREPGSECVYLRDCPALRAQRNWRETAQFCGYEYTSGRRRYRVCCEQETETVFREPTVDEPRANVVQEASECGRPITGRSNQPYVLGGDVAPEGMWPWMVAITEKNRQGVEIVTCTAFLIDRRHALSAAHCLSPPDISLYEVRIGDVDWHYGKKYPIRRITVHQGYRQNFFYDDIAMITFEEEITDPKVAPVCLPSERLSRRVLDGLGTTVAGWGSSRAGGPMSDVLQYLSAIPVIANNRCNRQLEQGLSSFRRQFAQGITRGLICAGFLEGGKDSCGGDSGGPLMYLDDGRWTAVGIVSFGYDCGKPGFPAGYTRISEYMDWIARQRRS